MIDRSLVFFLLPTMQRRSLCAHGEEKKPVNRVSPATPVAGRKESTPILTTKYKESISILGRRGVQSRRDCPIVTHSQQRYTFSSFFCFVSPKSLLLAHQVGPGVVSVSRETPPLRNHSFSSYLPVSSLHFERGKAEQERGACVGAFVKTHVHHAWRWHFL